MEHILNQILGHAAGVSELPDVGETPTHGICIPFCQETSLKIFEMNLSQK